MIRRSSPVIHQGSSTPQILQNSSNPGTCPEWIPIKRKTKPGKMYPKMSLKRTNPRIKPASRSVQDVFSAIGPLYHLNLASETKRTSAPVISDIFLRITIRQTLARVTKQRAGGPALVACLQGDGDTRSLRG